MKEKRIRMYLIFWFAGKAEECYRKLPSFGITKVGTEYIKLAYTEQVDKKCPNFDMVLADFLAKCKQDEALIKKLVDNVDGKFDIEIVPEMTATTSLPGIVLNRELIGFINTLKDKFEYLEVDSYLI